MTTTDPVDRIEAELGLLMRRARASTEHIARQVHPDLDPAAYPLLVSIAREPGVRASELAEHIGVGRGTMSRQLGRLERLGLIARSTDPADSRGQPIRLTPTGQQRVAAARQARSAYLRTVLAGWDPPGREALADLLGRLNQDLVAHRTDGPQD